MKKAQEFRDVIYSTYNELHRIKNCYKSTFWKQELAALCTDGARFLQCDKNLGVQLVDADTYNKLANRELHNYEVHRIADDTIRSEAMIETIREMRCIAQAIGRAMVEINVLSDKEDIRKKQFLIDLRDFILSTLIDKDFKFPQLRLLLKIHKPRKADGLFATRPIVPNCSLPSYELAKWLGKFMAQMARQIPWNLESTDMFIDFLTAPKRSRNIAVFDFTNLYGTEPVRETLDLFFDALFFQEWHFETIDDQTIFEALLAPLDCPEDVEIKKYFPEKTCTFMILLAECIHCTIAELDLGNGDHVILATEKFLAMGCPPVAPLSIITLAYIESKHLGYESCKNGMRRLIDDICIDLDVIGEERLRSIYPAYLELNYGEQGHFLDVQYVWSGGKFAHYPYIKPHATVPLNANSCHPWHTLRASAKNELIRLRKLCSEERFIPAWTEFWRTRYNLAGYHMDFLSTIEHEVRNEKHSKSTIKQRDVSHVEVWRGTETGVIPLLRNATKMNVCKTWKVERSLLSLALKAHEKKKTGTSTV